MHKASVLKGSDLKPLTSDDKPSEVVHVFGQNLEERVVSNEDEKESPSITFDIVDKKQTPVTEDDNDISSIKKRKFDAITGEEDEVTIFQGEFKLFVWDLGSSNWVEKGRGLLKLNDSTEDGKERSRLIMRIGGTLRIILNVAIKRSYFRVLTNSKTNIRFTDSQTVWAASGSNACQLKDLLDERLKISAEQEELEAMKKPKASDEGDVKEEAEASAHKRTKPDIEACANTNSTKESPPNESTGNAVPNKSKQESRNNESEPQAVTNSTTEDNLDDTKSPTPQDNTAEPVTAEPVDPTTDQASTINETEASPTESENEPETIDRNDTKESDATQKDGQEEAPQE